MMNRRQFIGNGSVLGLGVIFGMPTIKKASVQYYVPKSPIFLMKVKDVNGRVFQMHKSVYTCMAKTIDGFFKENIDKKTFVYSIDQLETFIGEKSYYIRASFLPSEYQLVEFDGESKIIEI